MKVEITKIKVNDRIRKDLGNLQELADDIRENGLINPPVVTPDDYVLIAGERRLEAMKLLGYTETEVRLMTIKDADHQLNLEISENETRKDFSKAERIEYARRLEKIESLKARERVLSTQNNNSGIAAQEKFPELVKGQTRDAVAEKLNIGSGRQYEKEKYICDHKDSLTPEDFADWDEGRLSTNKAYQMLKNQNDSLKKEVKELKSKDTEVVIDKTDYAAINRLEAALEKERQERKRAERLAEINQKAADQLNKFREKMDFLAKPHSDIGRQITAATELSGLTRQLQDLLENTLAPIKFKRCIEELGNSCVAAENLTEILNKIDMWSLEMHKFLKPDYVEVI